MIKDLLNKKSVPNDYDKVQFIKSSIANNFYCLNVSFVICIFSEMLR